MFVLLLLKKGHFELYSNDANSFVHIKITLSDKIGGQSKSITLYRGNKAK